MPMLPPPMSLDDDMSRHKIMFDAKNQTEESRNSTRALLRGSESSPSTMMALPASSSVVSSPPTPRRESCEGSLSGAAGSNALLQEFPFVTSMLLSSSRTPVGTAEVSSATAGYQGGVGVMQSSSLGSSLVTSIPVANDIVDEIINTFLR